MSIIHLAGVGSQYHPTERTQGGAPKLVGPILTAIRTTLCDVAVPGDARRTMLPHDHPEACPVCLERRPRATSVYLLPVRFG